MPIPKHKRTYPNDFDHERFLVWHKSRAQAHYRNEKWELSPEDYFSLWPQELWSKKGRRVKELCLTRKDSALPWRLDNCEVVPRIQQLHRSAMERKAKGVTYKRSQSWRIS